MSYDDQRKLPPWATNCHEDDGYTHGYNRGDYYHDGYQHGYDDRRDSYGNPGMEDHIWNDRTGYARDGERYNSGHHGHYAGEHYGGGGDFGGGNGYDRYEGLVPRSHYYDGDFQARNGVDDPLARPDHGVVQQQRTTLPSKPPPPSFEKSMPKEKQDILYGRSKDQKIEVAPGVQMRLRGAAETWNAVERDFYTPCECFACSSTVFCIQDAEYVICPNCRVVSPLVGGSGGGGVGLGFTMEDLARWQEDIVRNMERKKISRGPRY